MYTFADYLFLGAVLAPPVLLAAGFLYLVSPRRIEQAERQTAEPARAH